MFRFIEGLPPNVLGIVVIGKITHQDYRDVLIPQAERMLANGPLDILTVIGPEFKGFEVEALWDDSRFGLKHWNDFNRVAVATDSAWVRGMTTVFAPLFRGEVKLFKFDEVDTAKSWIVGPSHQAA
jgi:hypothetical protein